VIRRGQIERFEAVLARQFVLDAMVRARERFPHLEGTPADELETLITDGIARAQGYGIAGRIDLLRYLDYVARHGLAFEQRPEFERALAILERTDLTGSAKMDQIDTATRAR